MPGNSEYIPRENIHMFTGFLATTNLRATETDNCSKYKHMLTIALFLVPHSQTTHGTEEYDIWYFVGDTLSKGIL
jgi:hypothetical protein